MRPTKDDHDRQRMLETIRRNIMETGHHITLVQQSNIPRYAYTIGLSSVIGTELLLAGAIIYYAQDVYNIINIISKNLKSCPEDRTAKTTEFGSFNLIESHFSWTNKLLLGAFDYFETNAVAALQLVPDSQHLTIDVPDTSLSWNPLAQPVWRWVKEPWAWPIPEDSQAVTNLAALRGEPVTEASRWGIDEWQLFAGSGPDTPKHELRVVPIATLVGPDPSLAKVLILDVGKSLWRRSGEGDWQEW